MNGSVQSRIKQPLGLIEIIDRSEAAIAAYPETPFVRDEVGIIHRVSQQTAGTAIYGGIYSLFTRMWLGLQPPTGSDPGYCGVVGEVYEVDIPIADVLSDRVRPIFLLDEAVDHILPRLLRAAANLKDIYCPRIIEWSELDSKSDRHDPYYQLLIPAQEDLQEDLKRLHHGISGYPPDLSEDQCKKRWPWFKTKNHIASPMNPPYKEDPERLMALIGAMQQEKTDTGQEMFGVNATYAKGWHSTQWQTPHMAVAMVAAAYQRWDWTERVNLDVLHDGYPMPTEEEEDEERRQALEEDAAAEVVLYSLSGKAEQSAIEAEGMDGYRRLLGLPKDPEPQEGGDADEDGDVEIGGMVVPI